jgi:serine/threonine protein kinase
MTTHYGLLFRFLSPEMVNFVPKFYPPVIDVWQMGVISYFLIRGKTIYTSYKSYHGVDRSGSHFIQEYVRYRKQIQEHSDEAKIFIDLALQDSTKKRPSAYALACSKWINGDYKDRTPLEKQKYKFYMNQCLPKHAEATCIYVPLV